MLNDSGIDFSRDTTRAAVVATVAGRNPFWIRRSTISPTIVLDDGRAVMVVGAPGGGRIVTEILQNMVYVLDYGLDPLAALRMPRIYPSAPDRGRSSSRTASAPTCWERSARWDTSLRRSRSATPASI